jgi:uncharacterized protein (UPF0332 family)
MHGNDFLTLAARLAGGSTEAEWRTAVSRAYYAAFHAARDALTDMGFAVPRADQAHQYLYHRLNNCGHPQLQQAGRELSTLRWMRNQADYELTRPHSQQSTGNGLRLAQAITRTLALATVEPARTQVRDAIIAYERTAYGQTTWTP